MLLLLLQQIISLFGMSANHILQRHKIPSPFQKGYEIRLQVNSLTSFRTQISRNHYELPVCVPEEGIMQYEGSFAESMLGHKVQSSPYRVNVLSDVVCQKVRQMTTVKMNACHCMPDLNHFLLTLSLSSQEIKLCQVKLDTEQASRLQRHIDSGYHQNWILDGLPSASVISHDFLGKDITSSTYVGGFPIGFQDPVNENEYYVYNHLDIRVGYHE